MKKLDVTYEKNGKKVSDSLCAKDIKKLLKDVVRIQISTRYESVDIKDSIENFLKNYKKYGIKNLASKYNSNETDIKDKLMSLGVSG